VGRLVVGWIFKLAHIEELAQMAHFLIFFNNRHPGCKPISLPINSNLAYLMTIAFIFAGFTTTITF
jgi:hypothetical protein